LEDVSPSARIEIVKSEEKERGGREEDKENLHKIDVILKKDPKRQALQDVKVPQRNKIIGK